MMYRKYIAFAASLSAAVFVLGAKETFAASGAVPHAGPTTARSVFHSPVGPLRHHHRGPNIGAFWPGDFGYGYYGPGYGEPPVDMTQPAMPSDVRYTTTYDVPWDWAHRFPPMVAPSERPYVSSCPAETVKVPGHNGEEQTINITRCY